MMRLGSWLLLQLLISSLALSGADTITFPSGQITLHGVLYKPAGTGPFPAVIYNHGSARGMLSQQAFDALGPVFANHGWVFFGPYRRGQGLSEPAGPYIGDQIAAAEKKGGTSAGAAVMVRLLETDHLSDQLAALEWLRKQGFVQQGRIAVAGTSFGGIETVLGAERVNYCAAIDSAGGCPKLEGGARVAIAYDSRRPKCQGANFLFSGRKRLRPLAEQYTFYSDEGLE